MANRKVGVGVRSEGQRLPGNLYEELDAYLV